MTNVPEPVREMWTDLYKLFDVHYLMENSEKAWTAFWNEARNLWEKHGRNDFILDGSWLVASYIEQRMKQAKNAVTG